MGNYQSAIEELKGIAEKYDNIVFFGGAGVSTESGIPDFRSVDGLYHQQYDYPPETILSHTFYRRKPEEFYRFYRNKMLFLDAKPNTAHLKLAQLEAEGKLRAVITQNIDGLHQAAGSKTVLELHGSVLRNYCEKCGAFYDAEFMLHAKGVPGCEKCGGRVKPDVVLYEEGLDQNTLSRAVRYFLIWTGFIGAAYAFITREHMCLVLVRDSLKPEKKRILMTFIDVLILVFAIFVITIGGFKLAMSAQKVFSALLGIPRSLVYAMAPVSGLFIIVAQIINIYEDVTGITIEGGNES